MPAARASKSSSSGASKKKTTKKTTAKKTTSKKSTKKAAAKKPPASKKAPAKKAAAKKATAKKSAKKAPAKKAPTAKKASAKDASTPSKAKKKLPKFLTDKKWLAQQKASLLDERQSYTHSAAALAAEAASLMADREPGDVQFDEESGEGDTLAVERDRDLALSAKAREKVDEIDEALKRLEAGTYGICVSSGEVIPKERLEALPMAAKTVAAQTAMF